MKLARGLCLYASALYSLLSFFTTEFLAGKRKHGGEKQMTKCKKRWYLTATIAEQERQRLIATATDKKHARQFVVYCCRDCKLFHVGHLRRRFADQVKQIPVEKPAPKPPTAAQLRRAEKRLEKDNARAARHAMKQAGWDFNDLDVVAQRAADFLDSYAIAKRLADELFAGLRPA